MAFEPHDLSMMTKSSMVDCRRRQSLDEALLDDSPPQSSMTRQASSPCTISGKRKGKSEGVAISPLQVRRVSHPEIFSKSLSPLSHEHIDTLAEDETSGSEASSPRREPHSLRSRSLPPVKGDGSIIEDEEHPIGGQDIVFKKKGDVWSKVTGVGRMSLFDSQSPRHPQRITPGMVRSGRISVPVLDLTDVEEGDGAIGPLTGPARFHVG